MKLGYRTPSLKKSVKARTTGRVKRAARSSYNPYYGKKGTGWVSNPKKAAYNKVYHQTTSSVFDNDSPISGSNHHSTIDNDDHYKDGLNLSELHQEGPYHETAFEKVIRYFKIAGSSILLLGYIALIALILFVVFFILHTIFN